MNESDFEAALAVQAITLEQGLHAAREFKTTLKPIGSCYNCATGVNNAHLFCDSECEQDYNFIQQRRVQNTKVL